MKVSTFNILMKISSITTIVVIVSLLCAIILFIVLHYSGVDLAGYGKLGGIIYAVAFGILILLMITIKIIFIVDKRRNG